MRIFSILARYLTREIGAHLGGIFVLVLAVFLVRRTSTLLGEVLDGTLPVDVIGEFLGLRTVMALPSILPVVLYLAVVLALGRLGQDREMTALAACGVSPRRIVGIIVATTFPVALVIGVLALWVRPWAGVQVQELEDRAWSRLGIGSVGAGRFYELEANDGTVVFVGERTTRRGAMRDVFLHRREGESIVIVYAGRAEERLDPVTGKRRLHLFDGYRYDLRPEKRSYDGTRFGGFSFSLASPAEDVEPLREKAVSSATLLGSSDPSAAAELQWRLAMPLSTLILVLLAVPLGEVVPRQGRTSRILVAVLVYLVYRQLLGAARDWVANGIVAPFPGLWGVHALWLVIALLLLAREPLSRAWRTRAARGAA